MTLSKVEPWSHLGAPGSFDEIDTTLRVHIRDALKACHHQAPWCRSCCTLTVRCAKTFVAFNDEAQFIHVYSVYTCIMIHKFAAFCPKPPDFMNNHSACDCHIKVRLQSLHCCIDMLLGFALQNLAFVHSTGISGEYGFHISLRQTSMRCAVTLPACFDPRDSFFFFFNVTPFLEGVSLDGSLTSPQTNPCCTLSWDQLVTSSIA